MPIGVNNRLQNDMKRGPDSIYTYADDDADIQTIQRQSLAQARFTLRHIGGISQCEFDLSPGVTVLVGENATNRSSTLRGIGAAIGADVGTVRADATEATASVDIVTADRTTTFTREYSVVDGETVRTTFSESAGLRKSGVDALTDFAVLLEDNRLRRAVRRDGDLYDVLMSPVDTDEIKRQITQLQETRSQLEAEISEIERKRDRLPELKERKQSLTAEIEESQAALTTKQEQLESLQAASTETTEGDELTDTLRSRRRERNRIKSSIQQEQDSISGLEEQLEDIETELQSLDIDRERLATLKDRIGTLQTQKRELDETISSLSTLASLNSEALDGDIDAFFDGSDAAEALNPAGQTIECWTCGTSVERETIESRTAEIQQLAADRRDRRDELADNVSELRTERETIEQTLEQKDSLEATRDRVKSELATRRQRQAELRDEKEAVSSRIAELETKLAEIDDQTEATGDKVAISQEIGELEATIARLQSDREDVADEIDDISAETASLEDLASDREELTDEIRELRGVVSRKEEEVVSMFNERMDELLDRLAYDNVARVWLEKTGSETETQFVLNVTREDDVVYEDRVSNLSESEREIVGLMAAVVGHSVHNVGDIFPLMLLDSLEAIDAARIARLIDYLRDQTEFLVAALLEEDAAELPDNYTRTVPCSE